MRTAVLTISAIGGLTSLFTYLILALNGIIVGYLVAMSSVFVLIGFAVMMSETEEMMQHGKKTVRDMQK